MKKFPRAVVAVLLIASPLVAFAATPNVQITEWMYNGNDATGEYIEFTNLGNSAVDFSGWSFDDSSRAAGSVRLSAFGMVAAGQSVILTEAQASDFRAAWGLTDNVKVIGGNSNNLGRSDEINLYNAGGLLVDRLTYSDQTFAGTVRAQNASGNPVTLAELASSTVTTGWVLAEAGDRYGSRASTLGDLGNPGQFVLAAVPEPSGYAMFAAGLLMIGGLARRQSK
ncbi:lamin tail domain-containing protein [Dechloromonas denitrificans]|uniref:lamin tail domain-containing protein n=1 Tax=Dechloromonas denitrificans TaxID=281362 RepID=UPI001CF99CF8|nr:lamin tail domain-containing protein [Dechloromonas denitrificans]UCV09812.1 lamin tail domain-containing protein [Dechloromonas denitrificans]